MENNRKTILIEAQNEDSLSLQNEDNSPMTQLREQLIEKPRS